MPSALYIGAAQQPSEPLAVDVSKFGRADATIRLVSGLLDVNYDALRQREVRRQKAELFRAQAFFAAGLGLVLAAIAGGYFAAANYVRASELRATLYAGSAEELAGEGNHPAALLMALHGDPAAQRGILERIFRPDGFTTARSALARALVGNRLRATFPSSGRILAMNPTLDGREIVIANASDDGVVVRRLEMESGEELASKYLSFAEPVSSVALAADGDTFAFGSSFNNSVLDRLSAEDGSHGFSEYTVSAPDHIEAIAISSDNRRLLAGGNASAPTLWEVDRSAPVQRFDTDADVASTVSFMPDDEHVAIGTRRGSLFIWRIGQARPSTTFASALEDAIDAIAIHPAGNLIATLVAGGATIYNLADEELVQEVACDQSDVTAIAYSQDGQFFAAGCGDGTTQVWDTEDFEAWQTFGHGAEVTAVVFTRDSNALFTGQNDGAVSLWSVRSAPQTIFRFDADRPRSVISSDGRRALATNLETTLLLDLSEGNTRELSRDAAEGAGFLPGNEIIVRSHGQIQAVNPDTNANARILVPYSGRVVSASTDGRIILLDGGWWRAGDETPESVVEFPFGSIRDAGLQMEVTASALSQDGETAAVGTAVGFLGVRRSSAEAAIYSLEESDGAPVRAIAFFPGNERLIVGGPYGGASIWHLGRNTPVQILPDIDGVSSVAVSDDGDWISTGNLHGGARLWRRGEVVPAQTFIDRRLGDLTSVRFDPARQEFVALGRRGVARWNLHPALSAIGAEQVRMACEVLKAMRVLDFSDAEFRRFPILDRRAPHPCAGVWGFDPRLAAEINR